MGTRDNRDTLIDKQARALGYCCLYAFFLLNPKKSHNREANSISRLAKKLGMSTNAIEHHKRRLVQGDLVCDKCENCQIQQIEQTAPPGIGQ
jgi:hypothetical protein